MYYAIRYTVPEDSKLSNGQWNRKKMSACIKVRDEEHMRELVSSYCENIKRIHYDVEWDGVYPVGGASAVAGVLLPVQ